MTTATAINDESILVRSAQAGNEKAFEALFAKHKGQVYATCLRIVKDAAEAEDLTQDTFLQVLRHIQTFRFQSAFSTWLHQIAANTVRMWLRKHKNVARVSLDAPATEEETCTCENAFHCHDRILEGTLTRITIQRLIADLPAGSRAIVILKYLEDYQHHEIARTLGLSIGTSKSQLSKAVMKMRGSLLHKSRFVQ